MTNLERRILHPLALAAVAFLIATSGGQAAQTPDPPISAPPAEPSPAPPAEPAPEPIPQVTGTIVKISTSELVLKTPDGKEQKVALNEDTEKLVEIAKGVEVTVEYRRKISSFFIAERVLAAGAAPATEPVPAPVLKTNTATGDILSASDSTLVLRTENGDDTFFLAPSTEILVKPLTPGLRVTVEYREDKDLTKVAVRIFAAKSEEPEETPPPADAAPPSD